LSDPTASPLLSIVVPTYNERDRLGDLVSAIVEACRAEQLPAEIVVVDDNSPDGTGQLADELSTRYPVTVLHRSGKLGLGTAVVAGFAAARAPIVCVIDADLSHPPRVLPRMLAALQHAGADMVVGSRYIPGGGTHNWGIGRLLMSRIACLMAGGLTPVKDATSGFFVIRKDVASAVKISAGGFKICLELLVRGRPGIVLEIPYVFEGRTAGESKMNLTEALGYLQQVTELWRFRRAGSRFRPQYRRLSVDQLQRAPQARS
jgi:dolichol-phosphate mannosyltransferase